MSVTRTGSSNQDPVSTGNAGTTPAPVTWALLSGNTRTNLRDADKAEAPRAVDA